ncbi:hypothetical protein [Arthrobacter glacialis]|uniref:Uncharacterized protein n=1 Tax=Arthrobacter glacialis TaxID=1664 RepID=A0A2S3ZRB4_ARTGL|nr:hypothetical protein [Arthrobacter glacialis]POH71649.1 hypothetical protein CVS27_19870 [Arthrobacter glacialis]
MNYLRTKAAVAALLGFALVGCQPAVGSLNTGSSATVPSPSSSELTAIVQAAVEDRNGTVLDIPPSLLLADEQTTETYQDKRDRDLSVVARSKAGFKATGFIYTGFSTRVTVESIEVVGSKANVRFNEVTEQYQTSTADGRSSVPTSYALPLAATFLASADGWQIDSLVPSEHGGVLPMSVVED